jgi:hypothetical protein
VRQPRLPSCAWARHTDVADVELNRLSEGAYAGLGYAKEFTEEAPLRSRLNLPYNKVEFQPLTIQDIAEREGLPAARIRSRIARARRELFGEISDNAIYKRSQRKRAKRSFAIKETRPCLQLGCARRLPPGSHGNRDYCDDHNTPAARTRRYRAKTLTG